VPNLKVYIKIHKRDNNVILAICDHDLLGKTLKDGEIVFEIKKEFYEGYAISAGEALDLIEKSDIVNLVGNNIVEKAIEKGHVHPEAPIKICGVLHAQIIKL
jgi:hypothetical protein